MSEYDILLTGGGGQIGTELRRLAPPSWRISAPNSADLDVRDPARLAAQVAERPWAAVINCAAYTDVDSAESEITEAWLINALGPATLAESTARAGIPLIHLSTDYVFDGRKTGPYVEEDPVGPLSVYGASKEAGEQAVRTGNPRHVILRTAWVVSPNGHNFVKTMLRLAAERPLVRVVNDQVGSPTSAGDIALALTEIVERQFGRRRAPVGTFHFVNGGEASWYDVASAIFDRLAARGRLAPTVEPITTADYPTAARRPANSRLSCVKLGIELGMSPRDWRAAVNDVVDTLLT